MAEGATSTARTKKIFKKKIYIQNEERLGAAAIDVRQRMHYGCYTSR